MDKTLLRVYISGKITGMDTNLAKYKFANAANRLKEIGTEPINPMALKHDTEQWKELMAADIMELLTCNAILLLDNWHDSNGARIEYAIARERGLLVFFEKDLFPTGLDDFQLDGLDITSVNHLMEQIVSLSADFDLMELMGVSTLQVAEMAKLCIRIMNFIATKGGFISGYGFTAEY